MFILTHNRTSKGPT